MPANRLAEQPFAYFIRKDGGVSISHEGRSVMVVSGDAATRLAKKLLDGNPLAVQLVLAKITGNFKRGNERVAMGHGRKQGRGADSS